jgi:hypothetical protein
MPGCAVEQLAGGPLPPGVQPLAVQAGGARLVVTARGPEGVIEWWYSPAPPVALAAVPPAAGGRVAGLPVLAAGGTWAAWVQQKPGTGIQTWHARELRGAGELGGDPAVFGQGSYEVIGFDPAAGTLTLARNLAEVVEVDTRAGRPAGPPLRPPGVASQPGTFRSLRDGWFAWDAWREDAPWLAAWSVGGRAGRYEADWLMMISHAAVNPAGTHAVLSLESRFGRIPLGGEAIVLVRLADGREIARKGLPRFTRSPVAFLGDRHVAWTEGGRVRVARLPE